MEIPDNKIEELKSLIDSGKRKITILSHTNPDGDAIGSSLAWADFLRTKGHEVVCVVPNRYPYFLSWMPDIDSLRIYKNEPEEVSRIINESEIIFCLDFNMIQRLEGLYEAVTLNQHAKYVLIDHHLDPPHIYDLEFSIPNSSSTSYLIYELIDRLGGVGCITSKMAECLYVGIMTDTGNFSYSFLTPELFRAVAVLLETGINIPYINCQIYHSFTADRVRLLGYTLNKMHIIPVGETSAAYLTLTEAELRRFNFQQGDSEGFVNYPLTIKGVSMSAIFIETKKFIRISFRSRGDVDVSQFAKQYFEGGGHKNAAGGKSFVSMKETIEHYKKCLADFFGS